MYKDNYVYFAWQCALVLVCGIIGLIAVFTKTNLPPDISIVFALVFTFCIATALFFLVWIKYKIREEKEDMLIDSIGEAE